MQQGGVNYRFIRIFSLSLLLPLGSAARADRLANVRFDGNFRVCVYEATNPIGQTSLRTRRIPIAQPCPAWDSGEAPTRAIPSMATFVGATWEGNRRVCHYQYLGRRYERQVGPSRQCPLTPHFN